MASRTIITGWVVASDGSSLTLDQHDGCSPSAIRIDPTTHIKTTFSVGSKVTVHLLISGDGLLRAASVE